MAFHLTFSSFLGSQARQFRLRQFYRIVCGKKKERLQSFRQDRIFPVILKLCSFRATDLESEATCIVVVIAEDVRSQ